MITSLELGVSDGVSVSLVTLAVGWEAVRLCQVVRHCNHQAHRDFLITLYTHTHTNIYIYI
jgi:hypothetical protein